MKNRKLRSSLKYIRSLTLLDERRYMAAVARQEARRTVIRYDRYQAEWNELDRSFAKANGLAEPESNREYLAEVAAARSHLGPHDSDEKCAKDQQFIEACHISQLGHPCDPRGGRSYDELWHHIFEELSEPTRRLDAAMAAQCNAEADALGVEPAWTPPHRECIAGCPRCAERAASKMGAGPPT